MRTEKEIREELKKLEWGRKFYWTAAGRNRAEGARDVLLWVLNNGE